MSSNNPTSNSWNETEGTAPPDEPTSPVFTQGAQHQSKGVYSSYILILGPSGSGKSSLINLVSHDQVPVASPGVGPCTNEFTCVQQIIADRSFRLIDSPGLNIGSRIDSETFREMMLYLLKIHAKPAGILYLHPAENGFTCDRLKQNLEAIQGLFGRSWLPYLTIAAIANNAPSDPDPPHSVEDPTSPLHSFHVAGAKFRQLALEPTKVREILLEFSSDYPKTPKFQLRAKPRYQNGRIDFKALNILLDEVFGRDRARPSRQSGSRGQRLTLEESEENRQQLQLALNKNEEELNSLRVQLAQLHSEYGSLRSELQLHDNTEQNKVVQSLKDLNRTIEDFGRLVAQHLVQTQIEPKAEDTNNVTALQALDLPDLKAQFEHQDGRPSLVASSSGAGMPVEDFIDLALRSIVCRRLYEGVFLPFHPMLAATPEATFMTSLYEGIRRHTPQNVAAKWRANAFVALAKDNDSAVREEVIETQVQKILESDISKLIGNLFGQDKGIALPAMQHEHLKKIIAFAWEWNNTLKGEIVVLGDFQPTFYQPGLSFDTQNMLEFEPDKTRGPPETVICTIGLGLSLSHSKVKGELSGPIVVSKAIVVTEHFYTCS